MFSILIPPFFDRSKHSNLQPSQTLHLATATTTKSVTTSPSTDPIRVRPVRSKRHLPLEGYLYDPITVTNFIDLDKYKAQAALSKSIPFDNLSRLLDADLPIKVTLSAKLGTLGPNDGLKFNPIARAGFNLRLLDLGASDARQRGYLRFKAAVRSDGRCDHGFEIDRKIEVFSWQNTMLYGNVIHKTSNRSHGEWKTHSSFGVHQDIRLAGVKFAARLGLTPEGNVVYDLKL